MVHSDTTSAAQERPRPLYVVYGYQRDAERFRQEHRLDRWQVTSVTLGDQGVRGLKRPIILVDTDHPMRTRYRRAWVEMVRVAEFLNRKNGFETEQIWWTR